MIEMRIQAQLMLMITNMMHKKRHVYKRIVEAKTFIDENYLRPIKLEDMMRASSYSKFHFTRLFKQAYGLSPHKYLTRLRIKHAKHELKDSTKSIKDICFSLGFESPSSFSHFIKRDTSHSPIAYRKTSLETQVEIQKNPMKFIPGCYALIN